MTATIQFQVLAGPISSAFDPLGREVRVVWEGPATDRYDAIRQASAATGLQPPHIFTRLPPRNNHSHA